MTINAPWIFRRNESSNETTLESCPLTRREILAVQLSADGLSAKRVAHEMAISRNTVNNYLNSARDKLQLVNMASLVATAMRKGWIQ